MKNIFRSLLYIGIVAILIICTTIFSSAYGDSIASATPISIGNEYSGTISNTNTSDNFEFTLNKSGALNISAKAYTTYIYYRLYDENGNQLFSSNPYWNSTTQQSTISNNIYLTSGKYYFTVSKDGNYTGNYLFTLSFTSSNESFKEGQGGNNNVLATADSISFSKTYNGMLAINDSADFYKVTLASTGALKIDSAAKMSYIYCTLYDVDGNQLWRINPYWNTTSLQSTNSNTLYLNAGTYYVSFSKDGSYTGNYNFKLSFVSSAESFKETGWGINNSFDSANKLSLNKEYKGAICQNDSQDMYKFNLTSNMNVVLNFSAKGMTYIYVKIFDSTGNQIASFNPYWNNSTGTITMTQALTLSKGDYYLSVSKDGYCGNYSFKINDGKPGKTSKLTATSNSNKIKLTWKAVEGATGYKVYQYDFNKKKYKVLTTFENTSYTVKNLKPNTKYRFSVKAYAVINGVKVWSDVYTIVETKTGPAIVSKISATQTTSSIKLSWSKVTGATGYRVYQYNSKTKKYEKLKDTTSRSYTVKNLKAGTTYKFKIKAYSKVDGTTLWGSATDAFVTATKPEKVTLSKATAGSNKATLTWKPVTAASGYQIVYSTNKDFDNAK